VSIRRCADAGRESTVADHPGARALPGIVIIGALGTGTLGALGTIANLEPGVGTVTIESKTNFVAPAPLFARLIGEATPVHRGRTTMIWQTRITTQEGTLVALTVQTQLVLPRRSDA
jgi:thioesterase superfamily protein